MPAPSRRPRRVAPKGLPRRCAGARPRDGAARGVGGAACVLGLLGAVAWLGAGAAAADEARADAVRGPAPRARAEYWLDRLVLGPEETPFLLPNFHQDLLQDAEDELVALGDVAMDLLAEPGRVARVQGASDGNAWHAVLAVLARTADPRPDVVRTWALPALRRDLLTLRRAALPALARLRDPADVPVLLDALERDAGDGVMASQAARALLHLGPDAVAGAASRLYAGATVDAQGVTSALWTEFAAATKDARAPGEFDEALAWWALLVETGGPARRRPQAIVPLELAGDLGFPAGTPFSDALTSGARAGAATRVALARAGHRPYERALEADAASLDPEVARPAEEALARGREGEERGRARRRMAGAVRFLETLYLRVEPGPHDPSSGAPQGDGDGEALPPSADVAAMVRVLGADPDPEAASLLGRFLETPLPLQSGYAGAQQDAYFALLRRGRDPLPSVRRLLARGDPLAQQRALAYVRNARDLGFVPLLEGMEAAAATPRERAELRRLLAYLYSLSPRDGPQDAARAARVATWANDREDPSALGLVTTLLELGEPGERAYAEGLRGPSRAAYVAGLSGSTGRRFGTSLVEGLLDPVNAKTSEAERRATIGAAFRTASGAAVAPIEALVRRLPSPARAEATWLLRVVAHRTR